MILYVLKGISPFKMHKIIYFSRKSEKVLDFTSKFRLGLVTLNTDIFYLALPGVSRSVSSLQNW